MKLAVLGSLKNGYFLRDESSEFIIVFKSYVNS